MLALGSAGSSGFLGFGWGHLMSSGPFDGLDDILVAGAAAQVAFDTLTDFFFGWIGIAAKQLHRLHNHTRGAVAALQTVFFPKTFLDWVQFAINRQPFDGRYFRAIQLDGESGAAFEAIAID